MLILNVQWFDSSPLTLHIHASISWQISFDVLVELRSPIYRALSPLLQFSFIEYPYVLLENMSFFQGLSINKIVGIDSPANHAWLVATMPMDRIQIWLHLRLRVFCYTLQLFNTFFMWFSRKQRIQVSLQINIVWLKRLLPWTCMVRLMRKVGNLSSSSFHLHVVLSRKQELGLTFNAGSCKDVCFRNKGLWLLIGWQNVFVVGLAWLIAQIQR